MRRFTPPMQKILALQVDPLETLHPKADSSLLLALEAQRRGYSVFCYQPQQLAMDTGTLRAKGVWARFVEDEESIYSQIDEEGELDLAQASVVLIRQDPPFDSRYLANTYLLELLEPYIPVLNSPKGIRNACEKALPLLFPHLIPPTLISEDAEAISTFSHQHSHVILKPMFDRGGHGVLLLEKSNYSQIPVLCELYQGHSPGPIIVQPFLEAIAHGDKRIIMIDGDVVGGYRRIPKSGDIRANAIQGGSSEPCALSARDFEICTALSPILRQLGLFFVGIDVIGDYLIEVNVTSPTGLRVLKKFYNINAAAVFFDKLEG